MDTPTGSVLITCDYRDTPLPSGLLGKVAFNSPRKDVQRPGADLHQIDSCLQFLQGPAYSECFMAGAICTSGRAEELEWTGDANTLLVSISLNESNQNGLLNATFTAYKRLIERINSLGYPNLVRVWNYFEHINNDENELERYRQFCIGRFDAFSALGLAEQQFPSACAIGHFGGNLVIYALATNRVPVHYENPLQQQAYHYPKEYGPRSPSFARASLLAVDEQNAKIFVSGTASVVGNKTLHPESVELQTRETLKNLDHLLSHISTQELAKGRPVHRITPEILKVYVRSTQDLSNIQALVAHHYPATPTLYLHADICRKDLLLEIDGIWNLQTL